MQVTALRAPVKGSSPSASTGTAMTMSFPRIRDDFPCPNDRCTTRLTTLALLPFGRDQFTWSVHTLKLVSVFSPKAVLIATSAASRPRASRIRPIRGVLLRASKVCQLFPR
jgi:hypothetical protein